MFEAGWKFVNVWEGGGGLFSLLSVSEWSCKGKGKGGDEGSRGSLGVLWEVVVVRSCRRPG